MDSHSACIHSFQHVALIALIWSHCQPSSPSRLDSNVSLMASGSSTVSTAHLPLWLEELCMVFISRNTAKEQSFSYVSLVLTSVLYGLTASCFPAGSDVAYRAAELQQKHTWIQRRNPKFRRVRNWIIPLFLLLYNFVEYFSTLIYQPGIPKYALW